MIKRLRKSIIAVLLAGAMISPFTYVSTADVSISPDVKALEEKIAGLKNEQKQYENRIKEIDRSTSELLEKKGTYERQIAVINQKIVSTDELIKQYDVLISQASSGISDKENEIDARFDEFLARMSANYEDGYVNYLVLLLDSGSVTDMLLNTERTADALAYERSIMDSLESDKKDLAATKSSLEDARAAQEKARNEQKADLAEAQSKKKELAAYISELENDKTKTEKLRAEAEKANEELNTKLENLLAEIAKKEVQQHPVDKNSMIWPGPVNNNIVYSKFGMRDLYGTPNNHRGIDISAPEGTPIYAAQAGVVEIAEWHYSYGNYVVINHGGGYATLYAHAIQLNCKAGDTVGQGDTIAFVGNTGESYGNHCHFEVRVGGVPKQPLDYVYLSTMVFWED